MQTRSRSRCLAALLAVVTLTVGLGVGPAASAPAPGPASGRCLGGTRGPVCKFTYGRVEKFQGTDDGDGISVNIGGKSPVRVRVTGINAMEHTRYGTHEAGDCHALKATRRLRQLIDRVNDRPGLVRLAAQDLSSRSGNRIRRSVAVKINGRWRDLGTYLVREGLVLWLSNDTEYAWNNTYRRLAQRAAAAGRGVYDTDACRRGPAQQVNLTMSVMWDADGFDGGNLNGEWVHVRNNSAAPLPIGGWYLRDSSMRNRLAHGFTFPAGTVIPPQGAVRLHMGSGVNTASNFYFRQSAPVFENATRDKYGIGDGAYLFDRDGDLREWMIYPCVAACRDPLRGKVELIAQPRTPEKILVRNISGGPIDLAGHLIVNPPYNYPFTGNDVVGAGETLELNVLNGTSTPLIRYWGKAKNILNDSGDVVSLRTFDDQITACHRWGNGAPC